MAEAEGRVTRSRTRDDENTLLVFFYYSKSSIVTYFDIRPQEPVQVHVHLNQGKKRTAAKIKSRKKNQKESM